MMITDQYLLGLQHSEMVGNLLGGLEFLLAAAALLFLEARKHFGDIRPYGSANKWRRRKKWKSVLMLLAKQPMAIRITGCGPR